MTTYPRTTLPLLTKISPTTTTTKTSIPHQPKMLTTSPTLLTFLQDYATRLPLSSASKILCLDPTTHATLQTHCATSLSPTDQPTITLSSHTGPASTTQWPHPEAAFTHIFATLSPDLKTSVKGLKCIHFSLLWKGVAVLLAPEGGEVAGERVSLSRLVELGGFEPGKIRSVGFGDGEVCFAMRWDLLSA